MKALLHLAGCIIALAGAAPAFAAGQASPADAVNQLLDQARAAASVADADLKLNTADGILNNAGIDPTERSFLAAEIPLLRGQVRIVAWQNDRTQTRYRDDARKPILLAIDRYDALLKEHQARMDEIDGKLSVGEEPKGNKLWEFSSAAVSRATFWKAWGEYFLSLCPANQAERTEHLNGAKDGFALFTADTAAEDRKRQVVIESFLGRALCLLELGQYDELQATIDGVLPHLEPAARKKFTKLQLDAYRKQGALATLEDAARTYFDSLPAGYRHDKADLSMALIRAEALNKLIQGADREDYRTRYKEQLAKVENLLASFGDEWTAKLAKLTGKEYAALASQAAIEHYNAKRYQEAANAAEKGLKDDPKMAASAAAELRYVLALAHLKQQHWAEGSRASFEFIRKHPAHQHSAEMCGLAVQAAAKAKPPLPAGEVAAMFAYVEKSFPGHPEVPRLPWYRGSILLDAKKYAEAEAALRRVPDTSPMFPDAQCGVAFAALRQAEAADGADAAPHLKRAAAAVTRFAGKPTDAGKTAGTVAEVALAAGDRLLKLNPPDIDLASGLLDAADKLCAANPAQAPRREALRLKLMVCSGKMDDAMKLIDTLLAQQDAIKQALPALGGVSDQLELEYARLAKSGKNEEAASLGERLTTIYQALLAQFGKGADAPARTQETAVRRRLAHGLLRAGKCAEALPHYQQLANDVPEKESADVLRGLGIAQESVKDYEGALEAWRKLSKGLQPPNDGWYEAQLHIIKANWDAGNRDHAQRLLRLFKLQNPKIPSESWDKQFQTLGSLILGAEKQGAPGE